MRASASGLPHPRQPHHRAGPRPKTSRVGTQGRRVRLCLLRRPGCLRTGGPAPTRPALRFFAQPPYLLHLLQVCDFTTASFQLFSSSRPGSPRTPGSSAAAGSIPPDLSATLCQILSARGGPPSLGGRSPPPRAALRGAGAIPRVGSSCRASSPLLTLHGGRSPASSNYHQ